MPDSHAVLQDRDGRWALCFERLLGQPPERVWSALTAHDELLDWHPTPFELEPAAGGRALPTDPRGPRAARRAGARVRPAAGARLHLGRWRAPLGAGGARERLPSAADPHLPGSPQGRAR